MPFFLLFAVYWREGLTILTERGEWLCTVTVRLEGGAGCSHSVQVACVARLECGQEMVWTTQ